MLTIPDYDMKLVGMAKKKTKVQSAPNGQATRGRNRAYDLILADILRGKLSPGERLVESSLAEKIGVSRTPLR
jgi:DNA-binding GntR family transcriptional regulator